MNLQPMSAICWAAIGGAIWTGLGALVAWLTGLPVTACLITGALTGAAIGANFGWRL